MTGVLLWKEYREHRSVWLAMAVAGWLLLYALVELLAPSGVHGLSADKLVPFVLVALTMTGTYGLVCGAMMLANEKESRTLGFLETLPLLRSQLWARKLVLGVGFSALQGLVHAAAVVVLGLGETAHLPAGWFLALPLVAVEGFLFGLFGAALAGSVLTAILWAVVPLSWVWIIGHAVSWPPDPFNLTFRLLLAAVVLLVSWLVFSGADLSRRRSATLPLRVQRTGGWEPVLEEEASRSRPLNDLPSETVQDRWRACRALLWLTLRQGWVVMLGLALVALVLGLLVREGHVLVWLWYTLLVGVVCGVATFSGDLGGGAHRFLGEQRFPPGRVWAVKVVCWLAAGLGAAGLLFVGFAAQEFGTQVAHYSSAHSGVRERSLYAAQLALQGGDAVLFLALWLPHGFAVGQLCALVGRKTAVAFVVAFLLSTAAAAVWLPSLLCGGLHVWQVLFVPALLLLAGRLAMWTWAADRLQGLPVGAGVVALTAAACLWVGGNCAYRVLEVPHVGDPVDLDAFVRGLPTPEQNRAGPLVQRAADQLAAREQEVTPPELADPGGGAAADRQALRTAVYERLAEVVDQGWPADDEKLSGWLDQMFEGEWHESLRAAAALPLGVVENPLQLRVDTPLVRVDLYGRAGLLLAARASQLQAAGELYKSLDHLVLALNLARNVQHRGNTIHHLFGRTVEGQALRVFERWLQDARSHPKLLRRALHELTRHEQQRPSCLEAVQVEYLLQRMTLDNPDQLLAALRAYGARTGPDAELAALSLQTPWERGRALRLLNLLYAARLHSLRTTYPGILPHAAEALPSVREAVEEAAPAWESYLHTSPLAWLTSGTQVFAWPEAEALALTRLRAARLRVALLLYGLRENRPAATLAHLLRADLTELPADPFTGQPFRYRVSAGERIEVFQREEDKDLIGGLEALPGQGVLWSVGPDRTDHQGLRHAGRAFTGRPYPAEWRAHGLDIVFLVPPTGR